MFFYDFPNLLAIFIVILVSFRIGLIPLWLSFFLGITALTPFFLNDVLFPASLMPDQYRYLDNVQNIRSFDFNYYYSPTVEISSRMLAFIPLPYAETMQSLGFFNRLIATAMTIWLYSSKNLRGWPLLFFLFYPSFLLYSSLGLRDTLVLLFMMVSVILFLERKILIAFLFLSPLIFIKFQNFFLMIVFFVIHLSFLKGSFFYRFRYVLLPLILAALAPFIMTIIELLDFYRMYFFKDDGGDLNSYIPIKTIEEFLVIALQSAPYFMIKPLPWEADSFLQFIQSLENILLVSFLIFIFLKVSRFDKKIALKWFLFLIASFSIYGLTVFNFGTAVRYKFPFIVILVIGIAYELYLKHGKLILNKQRNR
jgi:hypothetical protein